MIPEFIICEKCGEKTFPDHEQHPVWTGGIFTYECECGWKTNVVTSTNTVQASNITTTTTRTLGETVSEKEEKAIDDAIAYLCRSTRVYAEIITLSGEQ